MKHTTTLGAGCFWCTEAAFQQLSGVSQVVSGYAGGKSENPSYREVCLGNTGHVEVCQITYDPKVIAFIDLLQVFWHIHDPTSLDRQGNDVGSQYRSVIFYHNEEQKEIAYQSREHLEQTGLFNQPIVTQIKALGCDANPNSCFYPAEEEHQNYYQKYPEQSYCSLLIQPKLTRLRQTLAHKASLFR